MGFRDEVSTMMDGYLTAYKAGDAVGCAAIYARDATIFSPFGLPIQGRNAIAAEHAGWFALDEDNKRIDIIDCAASGDLGYCLIAYSADVTEADGAVQKESGTNLCAMVRRSGTWQIRHSSMNATYQK